MGRLGSAKRRGVFSPCRPAAASGESVCASRRAAACQDRVFAGQLRRNSIVCPTEFYGETSPSCCFLGVLPRKVQVPEGRGVTFQFSATSDAKRINASRFFSRQCRRPTSFCRPDIRVMGSEKPSSPVIEVHLRTSR